MCDYEYVRGYLERKGFEGEGVIRRDINRLTCESGLDLYVSALGALMSRRIELY